MEPARPQPVEIDLHHAIDWTLFGIFMVSLQIGIAMTAHPGCN
ncbi:hypothetical protein CCACVL1_02215 [Corchorus capsularis]|uniref:Uncharacterized protein n=1 Tax=Corchorus capsularis TaxID=210143 RepID=A0A1R3KA96_COCAP|nr:hypothetical protein CCACVL1_02215 [Corchorus capsularis]